MRTPQLDLGRRPAWVSDTLFPFRSHFIEIADHNVHYVDEGSGPTLLLLHGNPTWSFLYRDVIARLAPDFRCVALDYPGFGLSIAASGYRFRPEEHGRVVARFIEALDLREVLVMVQDWGGPIGLSAAASLPERLAGLVIGDTRAWPDGLPVFERAQSRFWGSPAGRALNRRFNLFVNLMLPLGHARRKLTAEEMDHYRRPLGDRQARERANILSGSITRRADFLSEVERGLARLAHLPALIVWGEKEIGFTPRDRERFEEAFPNHRTVMLPGAGHFIQEDAPDEIAAAIQERFGSRRPVRSAEPSSPAPRSTSHLAKGVMP